ncbi:hypothetical protein GCM10010517_02700 [Streptosporangium fragile]|uniref:Uncharacterized protein n=1 Tax=Streptosporangium fragile TaxID=46186 RepID=A0ABP6I5B1_9ACTN
MENRPPQACVSEAIRAQFPASVSAASNDLSAGNGLRASPRRTRAPEIGKGFGLWKTVA